MEKENNKEQSKKGIHYPGEYQVSHNGNVCRVIPLNWEAPDHPEGKIQLLDGSIIDAYPKRVKKTPKPAELLTEESKEKEKPKVRKRWHIQTKRAKIRAHIEAHRIRTKDFYENAFFFLTSSLSHPKIFIK